MKRALSLIGWFLALAALILTATPAALAQGDDPAPLPEDLFGPIPDGELAYPPEWDPSKPDIVLVEYVGPGVVLNTTTDAMYDPQFNEVVLADGTIINHATGESLGTLPGWIPPFDPTSEAIPDLPATDATSDPGSSESLEPAPTDEPATDSDVATAEAPAADSATPLGASEFEDADPVLTLYREGFTPTDLEPYALDVDALPADAVDDSFQFLAYEIALLFEAGAFTRETPWFATFADLHDQFDFEDAPTDTLVQTFGAVDLEFARRALLYRNAIDPIDAWAVDWAIAELDAPFYDSLAAGDRGFLVGHEYAAALLRVVASGPDVELVSNGAAENVQLEAALAAAVEALEIQEDLNDLLRADNNELRALLAEFSAPAITTALSVLDAAPEAEQPVTDATNETVLYAAIGGGAAVVLLLALGLVRRRRRRRAEPTETHLSDLHNEAMATNQLLAGAKDEDQIVEILDRAGERQVKSDLTLFHALPDGLRRAGSSQIIVGSDLQRVVTTGQHATTTLRDDPAFSGTNRAVLAVPVIHGGAVHAVLVAHRDEAQPLGSAERAAMEPIAPALGGVLERSAELGTMSKLAMVDGLTSLGNRRRLDGDLETTLASAVAAGDSMLGFAMIDVDHFKTYNDTHGHTAGDEVLRRVAATIARSVREGDIVYRYGGEEFSILLPGASPEDAAAVAERVRVAIEAEGFPGEERQPGGRLTVSIGVATLASGEHGDLRERADSALYAAKEQGRNRVAHA